MSHRMLMHSKNRNRQIFCPSHYFFNDCVFSIRKHVEGSPHQTHIFCNILTLHIHFFRSISLCFDNCLKFLFFSFNQFSCKVVINFSYHSFNFVVVEVLAFSSSCLQLDLVLQVTIFSTHLLLSLRIFRDSKINQTFLS